jgi:hypothetical protein
MLLLSTALLSTFVLYSAAGTLATITSVDAVEDLHVPGGLAAGDDGMRSSYKHALSFGDALAALVHALAPQHVAEFGILDGYSLSVFLAAAPPDCRVEAWDLFGDFAGNHADEATLAARFGPWGPRVTIAKGNFWDAPSLLQAGVGYDLIHVDVANSGAEFEFALAQIVPFLSPRGVLLLEGGSAARDQVAWMHTYAKPHIAPVVARFQAAADQECSGGVRLHVMGDFPSLTVVRRDDRRGKEQGQCSREAEGAWQREEEPRMRR